MALPRVAMLVQSRPALPQAALAFTALARIEAATFPKFHRAPFRACQGLSFRVSFSEPRQSLVRPVVWQRDSCISRRVVCTLAETSREESVDSPEYAVSTFYHLVRIEDPHAEVARHLDFVTALGGGDEQGMPICGRIYINEQGINAQLSGRMDHARAYTEWLLADPRYAGMRVQTSGGLQKHAFPRLKLRYKPNLISLPGGTQHLPLTDPSARATPLTPAQWRERLANRGSGPRKTVLVDLRNNYEWDVGHFEGAPRPHTGDFRDTDPSVEIEPLLVTVGAPRQDTDVLMYCTGGIRCDIMSAKLRADGYTNLYTLEGGVQNYLATQGNDLWRGHLFVFDDRVAVGVKKPEGGDQGADASKYATAPATLAMEGAISTCVHCSAPAPPRHRNCANIDCNELFLVCPACLERMRGCCCEDCTGATRLRPLQADGDPFRRWHNYRPAGTASEKNQRRKARRIAWLQVHKPWKFQGQTRDGTQGDESTLAASSM
eukprot:jgi/Mesvir1/8353/Mv12613-RA.1